MSFKFWSCPKLDHLPLTPDERRTILMDDQTDGFFGLPWDGPIRGYYFNAYDEGRFPDARFRPLLLDTIHRSCKPYETVNFASVPWGGPHGRRWKQAVSPTGTALRQLLSRRTRGRAYLQTAWAKREGRYLDRFYTLSQGADMELAHLLYDGPMDGHLLHMVYCWPAIPFPTASADALAAGTAAHQPAILLDYDAPIQRLYLTIDTRTVDMAWVRRELDAACRERGLLFSDDLTIPSENL